MAANRLGQELAGRHQREWRHGDREAARWVGKGRVGPRRSRSCAQELGGPEESRHQREWRRGDRESARL